MKTPSRPVSRSARKQRAKMAAARSQPEAAGVEGELQLLNAALQHQISDKLLQLQAARRELEGKLDALKRDEAELRRASARLERLNSERTSQPACSELQGKRILMAADSSTNQLLAAAGAIVTTVADGEEAIQQLSADHVAFDAVLMDMQLPVTDGPEAARRIRRDLGLSALPIVALSAEAFASERQRALDAGMNALLTKPLDLDELLRALRADVDQAPAREREALDAWPSIAGVDRMLSFDSCSGDRSLLVRVLTQLSLELDALRAFDAERSDEPRLAAHLSKLQGSASTLGAHLVSAAAKQTLAATKLGHEQAMSALRHRLIPELEKLQAAILPLLAASEAEPDSLAPHENADQLLHALMGKLLDQRLDAVELFARVRSTLRARLAPEHLRLVQTAIENLQYERALELLMSARSNEAPADRA